MDKKNYTSKKGAGDESAYHSDRLLHRGEHQRISQPNIIASAALFIDCALLHSPLRQGEGDEVYAKEEAERKVKFMEPDLLHHSLCIAASVPSYHIYIPLCTIHSAPWRRGRSLRKERGQEEREVLRMTTLCIIPSAFFSFASKSLMVRDYTIYTNEKGLEYWTRSSRKAI